MGNSATSLCVSASLREILPWPDVRFELSPPRHHYARRQTRPLHTTVRWWEQRHLGEEQAASLGIPGPLDLRPEIAIPPGTAVSAGTAGKIVLHNDPCIDPRKAWPWEHARELVRMLGPEQVVLIGEPGPPLPGTLDLRGRTTLAEAAAVIRSCRCFVGIDSGPMWIAAALQVPVVGLYGTAHLPNPRAVQPVNRRAFYLEAAGPTALIPAAAVAEALARLGALRG